MDMIKENSKILSFTFVITIALLLGLSIAVSAQTSDSVREWEANVRASGASLSSDNAVFGVKENATTGFDENIDVREQPFPPGDNYCLTYFWYSNQNVDALHSSFYSPMKTMEWPLQIAYEGPEGQSKKIKLDWNVSSLPSGYSSIQLLDDSGNIVVDNMKSKTSYTFTAKDTNSKGTINPVYYDFTISVNVDLTAPPAPELISPENNLDTNDNLVTREWEDLDPIEETPPVTYRAQLDNDSDFSSPRSDDYWIDNNDITESLPDGTYYWRVRAEDNAGNIGPWSGINNFTVDTVEPPVPSLQIPADGITVNSSFVTFGWENIDPLENTTPVDYQLRVATDSGFNDIVENTGWLTDNFNTINLVYNGTYYWQVRARDNAGNVGSWASYRDLTVEAPPTQPTLEAPDNGAYTNDNTPLLEWTPALNVDNHRLLVDNDSNFSSPEENVPLGATDENCEVDGLSDDEYYWKIVASNTYGDNQSSTWSFVVDTVKPKISGIEVTDIGIDSATIKWETDENADSLVRYGTDTTYGSTASDSQYVTSHSIELTGLTAGKTYHFKVESADKAGNSVASSDKTFTTLATADIEVDSLRVTPKSVEVDEEVKISVGVKNVGGVDGSKRINVRIDGDVLTSVVSLDAGASTTLNFTYSPESAGTYRVTAGLYSVELEVTSAERPPTELEPIPEPADLQVTSLSVSPKEVNPGERVLINVGVKNFGDETGTERINVWVDGEELNRSVTLAGGRSETLTFTVRKDSTGTYRVRCPGFVRRFTVSEPPSKEPVKAGPGEKPEAEEDYYNALIFGIAAIIILALIVIASYWRRSSR